MAGVRLDEFHSRPELAPLWRHKVLMPTLRGSESPSPTPPRPEQIIGGSFSFPFVDAEARAHSGSYTYYPQFNNIDAIDITFAETFDYQITKYLVAWMDRVFSGNDGTYSESSKFKHSIFLRMVDNQDNDVIEIRYNGTFPTRINPIEVSENDEYYQVSCNFSVDSNNFNFLGGS